MKGKFNAEKALEVEKAVKLERDNAEHRIKKLESEKQSLVYQLNESDSNIKAIKNQMDKLESELVKQANSARQA
jgi:dihydroorotase